MLSGQFLGHRAPPQRSCQLHAVLLLIFSFLHCCAAQQTCTRTLAGLASSSRSSTSSDASTLYQGAYSGSCAPFSFATLPAPPCGPLRVPPGGVLEFGTCVLPSSFCNQGTTLTLLDATTGALLAKPTVVAPDAAANSNSGASPPLPTALRSHLDSVRRSLSQCTGVSVAAASAASMNGRTSNSRRATSQFNHHAPTALTAPAALVCCCRVPGFFTTAH